MKKSYGHIRETQVITNSTVFKVIKKLSNIHSIPKLCEALNVPKSSYYEWLNHTPSKRDLEKITLTAIIKSIWLDSKMRYGAPKIKAILKRDYDLNIGIKQVQAIMKENDICSITVKRYKPYPHLKTPTIKRENLLKRDFATNRKNQKWVSDMTYVYTKECGWTYLATILDLFTKKIVGWSYGKEMNSDLVKKALENALFNENLSSILILHSDQGIQYTSEAYEKLCKEQGTLKMSFSAKGCPYDNAPMESFNAIIKKELVNHVEYETFDEAKVAIFEYIECWYNRERIHGSLGNKTPLEFEQEQLAKVGVNVTF